MPVNASAIHGEKNTGFEKAGDKGLFQCGNCHYFSRGGCKQIDMVRYSEQPRRKDGYVAVDAGDCCEYVDRIGWRSDKASEAVFNHGFAQMMHARPDRR